MNYTLNIRFTNEQLQAIYATESKVVLAQLSQNQSAPNIAWQVFSPFQSNSVTWEQAYGMYASTTEIHDGITVTNLTMYPAPVVPDKLYILQADGKIVNSESMQSESIESESLSSESESTTGAFKLRNQYGRVPYMTIGLSEDAIVNGTQIQNNAISAKAILLQNTAMMRPSGTMCLWLQSDIEANKAITEIGAPLTQLNFDAGRTEITVGYDTASGLFFPIE